MQHRWTQSAQAQQSSTHASTHSMWKSCKYRCVISMVLRVYKHKLFNSFFECSLPSHRHSSTVVFPEPHVAYCCLGLGVGGGLGVTGKYWRACGTAQACNITIQRTKSMPVSLCYTYNKDMYTHHYQHTPKQTDEKHTKSKRSTYSTQIALAVTTFRVSARFFCVKVNQLSTCNMW